MRLNPRAPSSTRRRTSRRMSSSPGSQGETDGPDCAHRRPRRAARRGDRGRAEPILRAARCEAWRGCSATGSTSNCSATALPAERTVEPALIELAYRAGIAAGRDQRAVISRARDDYEAHDALICIAEGRLIAETDRRQLTPEHRFKTRGRDGGAVCRPAGGARLDASRSPSAAPSGRAARTPILPRFTADGGSDAARRGGRIARAGARRA